MSSISYRDPLPASSPFASVPPLTDDRNQDGKSLLNPLREDGNESEWYRSYPEELDESNNAFECVFPASLLLAGR